MANNAYKRAVWLAAVNIGANVIVLGAAVLGMYMSYRHPSEALLVFCQWFFAIAVLDIVAARFVRRWVRLRFADPDQSLVRLPGHRRPLIVRWRVADHAVSLSRSSSGS